MSSDDEKHENWIRESCLQLAVKQKPFSSADEVIKLAGQYAKFVFNTPDADVVKLVCSSDPTSKKR